MRPYGTDPATINGPIHHCLREINGVELMVIHVYLDSGLLCTSANIKSHVRHPVYALTTTKSLSTTISFLFKSPAFKFFAPPKTEEMASTRPPPPAPTPFHTAREALVSEIAQSLENVLQNINKLNRSLEGVIAVGNEFGSVEALWSQFEGVMSAKGGDGEEEEDVEQEGGGGRGEEGGGGGGGGGEGNEIDENEDKKGQMEGGAEEQDGSKVSKA